MDPLSGVLSLLKPRSYMVGGFEAGGDWSIRFEQHDGIKCYAVLGGQCWLAVEGVADPVLLTAGDCFLLPRGRPFCVASDLALPAADVSALFSAPRHGGIAVLNGGGGISVIGGFFMMSGQPAATLLGMLPPIVHLRTEAAKASLRWSLEQMRQELREQRPGGFLMAQHLAHIILVQAMRLHLDEGMAGGVGWLFALADPQMRAAITALHAEPARRWTLEALAQEAGMSRSSFAEKFKATVGSPAMDYLTRWRMLLAADRLTGAGEPVGAIALSLGYESESAFSAAFKRVMGCAPRDYGRQQTGAVLTPPPPAARSARAPDRTRLPPAP